MLINYGKLCQNSGAGLRILLILLEAPGSKVNVKLNLSAHDKGGKKCDLAALRWVWTK